MFCVWGVGGKKGLVGGGGGGGASIVRCEIYHVPEPDRYMVRKVYNCRDVPR